MEQFVLSHRDSISARELFRHERVVLTRRE